MIDYPGGPCPPECEKPRKAKYKKWDKKNKEWVEVEEELDYSMYPGEGIFAPPFEALKYLDLEFPMGTGSGVYISLMFQLGKWGYARADVKHTIDVSPVYKEYYSLIMDQKEKLEGQVKNGFASLTQAIQDFELIDHDLRKYAEYLKWFRDLERAKRDLEEVKKKNDKPKIEEAEKNYKEKQHIIKAMFIDQVDAHTGESVSLRGIAPRWPTIIADFMDLYDEDVTDKDIQDRLNIPRAEAIILKTKNELYRYWKETFLTNIISRYKRLKQMALARKFSIKDTADDLVPIISRYKSIKDARFDMKGAAEATYNWSRLDAQAIALDEWEVWAWKPFIVKEEPFPNVRFAETPISLNEAGFNKEEREQLKKSGTSEISFPMPAIPIMDRHVRNIMKMIESDHGIKLSVKSVVECAQDINKRFSTPDVYSTRRTGQSSAVESGPRWEFSSQYIFLRIPILRYVLKLPNGGMMEDMVFSPMQSFNATQNIIIGHMLEIKAIREKERREIALLLGLETEKLGESGGITGLDDILKAEYPEFDFEEGKVKEKWEEKEKKEEKEKLNKFKENFENFKEKFENFRGKSKKILKKLGLDPLLFWYPTPYEKMMAERMTKMIQRGPGMAFLEVDQFLKKKAGVPGV